MQMASRSCSALLAAWMLLVPSMAMGDERLPARREAPPGLFSRGAVGVELTFGVLGEAWNLNERREWLLDGTGGVWWAFTDRLMLVVEMHATRVYQARPRPAFVQGFTPLLRWRVAGDDPWTVFVDVGPGISWSDTIVPPRGTRFNYLLLAGTGVSYRLSGQVHAVTGVRWLHLSNNGREGRARNPDIEALGGYGGVAIAF